MNQADFWADAGWFPQQVDLLYGRVLLLRLTEQNFRQSMFLDQRLAAQQPPQRVEALWPLLEASAAHPASPATMIFHVGHCGSTLLSRVLQEASGALALREPVPLRALAQCERQLTDPLAILDPARYPALREFLFTAYARSFRADQPVLVKATSSCSNLLEAFLEHHAGNRAVFLYLPLEAFLATLLRSDLRRQETANFAQSRLDDLQRLLGCDDERIYRMSPGELAAMSWAANMLWLAKFGAGDHLHVMDFEALLDDPVGQISTAASFAGLAADTGALAKAYREVTAGYSKDPSMRYSRQVRDVELDNCRREWAPEIDRGLAWARRLVDRHEAAAPLSEWLGLTPNPSPR